MKLRGQLALALAVLATLGVIILVAGSGSGRSEQNEATPPKRAAASSDAEASVELEPSQLGAIKIQDVGTYEFPLEKSAIGNIDYDQDLAVPVFSPYQGRLIAPLVNLGDEVQKGQPLYTIDSPDLVQAESTLISAAATFALTTRELARVKDLYGTNGVAERELEQVASDQQTAEGALKAARDAVRLFGKTDEEIRQVESQRKVDSALVVRSPFAGRVTARNAQPGLLVQPGTQPAPYTVADLATKWMVANVTEADSPLFRIDQPVRARVAALEQRVFEGKISNIGTAVDPTTHRVMLRCEILDANNELKPGMLASFIIQARPPVRSVAVPTTGVVRNGDGTMAAWVTTDRRKFVQRILSLGLQRDGFYQVLDGLKPGELAVADGAIFLSYMLKAPPSD